MPRKTSLVASARECADSARSAVDPDISPLISFAMAMTTFAASATRIVRQLSFLSILRSAARDRRFVGRSMNARLVHLRGESDAVRSAGRWPAGPPALRRTHLRSCHRGGELLLHALND